MGCSHQQQGQTISACDNCLDGGHFKFLAGTGLGCVLQVMITGCGLEGYGYGLWIRRLWVRSRQKAQLRLADALLLWSATVLPLEWALPSV